MLLLGVQLYRSLLREARALPDALMSEHYRTHIRSSFRQPVVPEASVQAIRRVKAAQKLLRHLQAANDGYLHALTRAYETAYGLRGKGKHAALALFLHSSSTSSPHSFPPPLAALVTSPLSHTSRPPSLSQLSNPPTVPECADPASTEARLLGTLPLQRERAIRRRWWNSQTGKIRRPLAIKVKRVDGSEVESAEDASRLLRVAGLALSGVEVLEGGWNRLAFLSSASAAAPSASPLPPRRLQTPAQRTSISVREPTSAPVITTDHQRRQFKPRVRDTKWHPPKRITSRLLRRLGQNVANQAVVMTLHLPATDGHARTSAGAGSLQRKGRAGQAGRWEVSLSTAARSGRSRYRALDEEEQWWYHRDEAEKREKQGKRGAQRT